MSEQNTTISRRRYSGLRAWTGPSLLLAAPAQYLAGAAILQNHPTRPVTLLGVLGLLLVFTTSLTLIAGLGESANLLVETFRRQN